MCIVGDVGSGKSSLLNAIIGDLIPLKEGMKGPDFLNQILKNLGSEPVIELSGEIAYV